MDKEAPPVKASKVAQGETLIESGHAIHNLADISVNNIESRGDNGFIVDQARI